MPTVLNDSSVGRHRARSRFGKKLQPSSGSPWSSASRAATASSASAAATVVLGDEPFRVPELDVLDVTGAVREDLERVVHEQVAILARILTVGAPDLLHRGPRFYGCHPEADGLNSFGPRQDARQQSAAHAIDGRRRTRPRAAVLGVSS
jgi:hypothetical protein